MSELIRLGTVDDLEIIKDIVFKAYSPYVEKIGMNPAPMDDDYLEKIEEKALHILQIDETIVGFIIVYFVDDTLLIENVAIDSNCHGKGYGRHLMKFAEDLAKNAKVKSIVLYTNELMTRNIEIYTKMGYTLTHRSEAHGLKRVHMSKEI